MELPIRKIIKSFCQNLLKYWKFIFRILLSVQLGLSSFPAYSQTSETDNNDNREERGSRISPLDLYTLGDEYEAGTLRAYLDENPDKAFQLDRFMMESQTIDLIQYEMERTSEGMVRTPIIKDSVPTNEYRVHPNLEPSSFPAYYPENPKEDHQSELSKEEGRHFFLEGKHQHGDILFKQYIPALTDVIADTQKSPKEPEFLVFLDPEKGLLIMDKEIIPIISGYAPIPIINVPVSTSKKELMDMKAGISVEFVRSIISKTEMDDLTEQKKTQAEMDQYILKNTTQPFDTIPQHIRDLLHSQGTSFFADGDLAIVYTDPQNSQRHLLEYIRRDTLRHTMLEAYKTIDIMITLKSTADILEDPKKLEHYKAITAEQKKQDDRSTLENNIYAVVIEEALHKLLSSHSYFQTRRKLLSGEFQSHHFSLEEWRKPRLTESQQPISGTEKKKLIRIFKKILLYSWTTEKIKNVSASTADLTRKLRNKDGQGLKDVWNTSWNTHTLRNLLLIAFTTGLIAPETFTSLLSSLFTYTENWSHLTGGKSYSETIMWNIIMAGFGVLTIGGLALQAHKPILWLGSAKSTDYRKWNPFKFLIQGMEKSKNYQKLQWWFQHQWDIWTEKKKEIREHENGRYSRKMTEMGVQLLALLTLVTAFVGRPFWNWTIDGFTRAFGQPLLTASLQRGLNPFTKIRHQFEESDNKEFTRLGWTGWKHPIYRKKKNPLYNEHKQVQDEFIEKSRRTENMAFLLSVLAVYNPDNKNPDSIRDFGPIVFDNEISQVINTPKHKLKQQWMMLYLSREMMEQVDQINLSTGVDVEYEYIQRFYKRAQELAQQFENTPYFIRRLNLYMNQKTINNMMRRVLFAFEDNYEFLKNASNVLAGDRFFKEVVPDHLVGKTITTGYMGRGSTEMGRMNERDYNAGSTWNASSVGIADVWQNLLAHGLLGAALTAFTLRQNVDELAKKHNKEIVEAYPRVLPDLDIKRDQTLGEYFSSQGTYPFNMNRNGTPFNYGERLRKRELGQWALWQVLVATVIVPRWASGELTLEESIMASLVYNFLALPLYRWPWALILGGAGMNERVLKENYRKQLDIHTSFLSLSRQEEADQEEKYREKYRKTLEQFVHLYKKPSDKKLLRFMKRISTVDMFQDSQIVKFTKNHSFLQEDIRLLSAQSSLDEIQKVSKRFVELMTKEPPLATQTHTIGNWTFAVATGPILTTLLATNLLIETWKPENLTLSHAISAFAGWSAFLLASNLYRKPFKKGLSYEGENLESWGEFTTKVIENAKEQIKDYREYRLDRKNNRQEVSANQNILKKAVSTCQALFRKSSTETPAD